MEQSFSVPLSSVIKEFNLEVAHMPAVSHEIQISCVDVNRPGLQIVGFFDFFDANRLQIIGKVEDSYLSNMTDERRKRSANELMSQKFPALVVTRGLDVFPEFLECAEKYGVPVLRTKDSTSHFMGSLIAYLNNQLAPRITRHGVLVEVYGEGALILGESGIGKSETAIELVKRGHRLVADDAVEIKRVSEKVLLGSAPEIIRHYIELRGIGIIDVKKIFGMGAVKDSEKVDLIIHLESWVEGKQYDRLGLVEEYTSLLDVNVPSLTIPVRPGRNLAIILEVACMNNRQKRMGHNAADELNQRLMSQMEESQKE